MKTGMTFFPYIKRQYLTSIQEEEIINRFEQRIAKPDKKLSIQKVVDNRIFEGRTTKDGFIVVMGRYGMTYGKTSLLPYLIGKFKPAKNNSTRLDITIQPSLGSGLVILSIIYVLAVVAIYISWNKRNLEGIIVPSI